jgi:hypothetical protein
VRAGWGALLLALGACSSATAPKKAAVPVITQQGVGRYFPLEDATVFSYSTRTEPSGEQGLLVLEVRRPRPDAAELWVAGRAQRLTVSAEALELATGGFLLRAPLEAGSEYQGNFGRVRVTRVGFPSRVEAGQFSDCLETVETLVAGTASRVTTTVFCAGAGIVSRRSEADSDEGPALESMELRSYGKKVVFVQ